MAVGIRVGSFNPNDGTDYTVRSLQHDHAPAQDLETLEVSRAEGAKLLSVTASPKTITLEGIIKGTSRADLEENIDLFKKSMVVKSSSMDMEYASMVRRYIVTTSEVMITRDFFHNYFAPFEVVFQVLDPPFGFQASSLGGSIAVKDTLSANNVTQQAYSNTISFEGTAPPRPYFRFYVDVPGNLGQIAVSSLPGGGRLAISTAFTAGDTIEVDTEQLTVKRNQAPVRYTGLFPEFELGDNTFLVDTDLRAGDSAVEVAQTDTNEEHLVSNQKDTMKNLSFRVETDSAGKPSGTLVTNGSVSLNPAVIPEEFPGWVAFTFGTAIALTAGTQYWMVFTDPEPGSLGYTSYKVAMGFKVNTTDNYTKIELLMRTLNFGNDWYFYWKFADSFNPYTDGDMASQISGAPWLILDGNDAGFKVYRQLTPNWTYDILGQYRKRYF